MITKQDHTVISYSSGKDSTAVLLLAKFELMPPNMRAVFCDTGHEHPEVYKYLDYIEARLQMSIQRIKPDFSQQIIAKRDDVKNKWPTELVSKFTQDIPGSWVAKSNCKVVAQDAALIQLETARGMVSIAKPADPDDVYTPVQSEFLLWVPAEKGLSVDEATELAQMMVENALSVLHPTGNPFLDLCLWKGRFPSAKARFCTDELKKKPMLEQVIVPLVNDPDVGEVQSWQGVRADESPARAKLVQTEDDWPGIVIHRPILHWTAADVFEYHRKHGVKWNPLYEMGMSRVGCMPCVNCRKDELREISTRFPEEIERVAGWEKLVSMACKSRGGSNLFHMKTVPGLDRYDLEAQKAFNIYTVTEWAMTSRGGRMFDLVQMSAPTSGCASSYGLCDNPVNDNGQVIFKAKV